MSEKTKIALTGCVVGLLNGFFGSGGGVIAVPMLRSCGFEQRSAHACSLAVTLPLSLISVIIYASGNTFSVNTALRLLIPGLIGAAVGGLFLKKISGSLLKKIFAIMMIIAGGRLLLR